jgi:hypothetical protein
MENLFARNGQNSFDKTIEGNGTCSFRGRILFLREKERISGIKISTTRDVN